MQKHNCFSSESIWCVIPVYNNRETVREVALACRHRLEHVIVVDDGSTDVDVASLFEGSDVIVLKHETNQGKGKAILSALKYVIAKSGRFMITLDGDGQHDPKDLEKFIPLLREDETVLVVGCRNFAYSHIPSGSRFGRAFANFWLHVETGVSVDDCQSGFRAYPVRYLNALKLTGAHYDFETEVLAKALWAGLTVKTVAIDVWYPKEGKRVSHFKPFLDNFRISCMHTYLVARSLLPLPHRKLVQDPSKRFSFDVLRHPVALIKMLLKENTTPEGLAAAAGVGVLLATLPLLFVHTIVILYVTARLHLNKIMAVSIQSLCMPPFVPVACIELGHYMKYGRWLTEVSMEAVFGQIPGRLADWLLGSLIIGPVLAVVVGVCVFFVARAVQEKKSRTILSNEAITNEIRNG
jgi:glycosyltransferase involved in cell wall biosynthesis